MRGLSRLLLIGAALAGAACHREESRAAGRQVTVAAAANLTDTVGAVGSEFEARTGIHPVFSFASTAELTQQIEHGAPFDVFLSADAEHVEALDREGLLAPGSRAIYAIGVLALWIPETSPAKVSGVGDLGQPGVKTIALAKPELAPYGAAAVEAMQRAGVWDRAQPKVVYANNINAAKQFGTAGNADAVFTAYSLVRNEHGQVIPLDDSLHRPLTQEAGIIAKSAHPAEARRFSDFLLKGAGREILQRFGYKLPSP
ncbi:MAG TPA: molybdate ABC transporter substrate-binding protein [Bryobacteraceae bacterium]|jgi:molybdate transport system substrate-binding protein